MENGKATLANTTCLIQAVQNVPEQLEGCPSSPTWKSKLCPQDERGPNTAFCNTCFWNRVETQLPNIFSAVLLNLTMPSKICKFFLTWWSIQQVTGLTGPSMLDMAPNAFDDQYEGCVNEMEKKAPLLLNKDFDMNEKLKDEWENAEERWNKIKHRRSYPKDFNDFHGTALVAYTGILATDFNRAVREFKKNPGQFHYKAFHYYLTRALQLLSNQGCRSVYRGTKTRFHYAGWGSVRFGHFASSSLSKSVALSGPFFSDTGTLFIIQTCLGVYIKEFSFFSHEEEVLIPGYEVYQKVRTQNVAGYNEIFLDSPQRKKSNFNCFYSSSGARESYVSPFPVVLPGLLVQLLALAEL